MDQLLLLTARSAIGDRQLVFTVQAHEMAHQWYGDLVTMGWWDDLWLNESFASWMAAKETDLRNPGWNWWEREDASKERAMQADARVNSHAIQQHVINDTDAEGAVDPEITYDKGQSVLRMLEAYLGPDTFRDGLRRYMKAHAYSNTSSADLWNALSAASGRDVAAIAAGWTEQAGFPVVRVVASCDAQGGRTIALSQQRFLLQGSDPGGARWNVPLQIRSGAQAAPRSVLLGRDGESIAAGRCDEALSINAGSVGFYRAAYDEATMQNNVRAFATIPRADRIAMLDDEWALVEAGVQPLPTFLALVKATGSDLHERAWETITQALRLIEYDERGTPGHDAFTAYARSIIKPIANQLGWQAGAGDTPGIQQLRHDVIRDLGAWGDEQIIAEARKRFERFVVDRSSIVPDDQDIVLSIVARYADAATFEQLHAIAREARNETEQRRYYAAMMRVRDPQLGAQAARIALSDEIPPQASALRLTLVALLDGEHPQLSWTTFTENAGPITQSWGPAAPAVMAQALPGIYWNSVPPDALEAWLRAHVPAEMAPQVARGMEGARFKLGEKTMLVEAADRYLERSLSAR
jgi:aminopeptidase N